MKLGDITFSCDRCGDEKQQAANSSLLPFGWQQMEFPKSYKRDLCPKCVAAFREFWYRQLAKEVPTKKKAPPVIKPLKPVGTK